MLNNFMLAEGGGKSLVGPSMWEDEAAFKAGMAKARPKPPRFPVETQRDRPPTVHHFVDIRREFVEW